MNDKINDTLGYDLPEVKFKDETAGFDRDEFMSRLEHLCFGTWTSDDGWQLDMTGDVYILK